MSFPSITGNRKMCGGFALAIRLAETMKTIASAIHRTRVAVPVFAGALVLKVCGRGIASTRSLNVNHSPSSFAQNQEPFAGVSKLLIKVTHRNES
jgi:hypothetical protein